MSISLWDFIGASLSELQGVMMSTGLACVRAYVLYVCVGEACLGASEVSVAGNECSLGSAADGWLRTSAEGANV